MLKKSLLTAAALFAVVGIVKGAGLFWGYPIIGQGSYCVTYQNQQTNSLGVVTSQGTCVNTAPAGPAAVTGAELLIADTQLPGTQQPQTVYMPFDVIVARGQGASRNVLIGSDFQTNLWQRGTTPLSAATPSTTTMSADRWGVYSSGNTVTVTKDVTAADVLPSAGVNGIMKVTRPSGTNTTSICVGQVLPQAESARFIGNEAVFSFYAEALAGYLQTNSTIQAVIAVYTAADSATPGTNTDAWFKGTIAGYTVLNPATVSTIAAPVTSNTTLPAGFPITTTLTRYSVAAYVPPQVLVSSTLTNVTGIGVEICTGAYPASTGVATDGFAFGNAQLEASFAGTQVGGNIVASPNTSPGGYARPWVSWDQNAQLAYSFVLKDGATTATYGSGYARSNAVADFYYQFPVQMREVPTPTGTPVAFAVQYAATSQACGTSIASASSSSTVNGTQLVCTTGATALTLGQGGLLIGANTGLTVVFSAEP